jgi:hypothetical protein
MSDYVIKQLYVLFSRLTVLHVCNYVIHTTEIDLIVIIQHTRVRYATNICHIKQTSRAFKHPCFLNVIQQIGVRLVLHYI